MSHVIIRGENGRRHFGEARITLLLHANTETAESAIEAEDPDRPSHKQRSAFVNISRHHKAMADLARRDRQAGNAPAS